MSIVVFWIDECETDSLAPSIYWESRFKVFDDSALGEALAFAEKTRKCGHRHVTISTELSGCVGKSGVSSVQDGKTPDGHEYEWSKQHRGGPPLIE